eukprot:scaffold29501_cov100-Isochrysis_galbana.AAC.4
MANRTQVWKHPAYSRCRSGRLLSKAREEAPLWRTQAATSAEQLHHCRQSSPQLYCNHRAEKTTA